MTSEMTDIRNAFIIADQMVLKAEWMHGPINPIVNPSTGEYNCFTRDNNVFRFWFNDTDIHSTHIVSYDLSKRKMEN